MVDHRPRRAFGHAVHKGMGRARRGFARRGRVRSRAVPRLAPGDPRCADAAVVRVAPARRRPRTKSLAQPVRFDTLCDRLLGIALDIGAHLVFRSGRPDAADQGIGAVRPRLPALRDHRDGHVACRLYPCLWRPPVPHGRRCPLYRLPAARLLRGRQSIWHLDGAQRTRCRVGRGPDDRAIARHICS